MNTTKLELHTAVKDHTKERKRDISKESSRYQTNDINSSPNIKLKNL